MSGLTPWRYTVVIVVCLIAVAYWALEAPLLPMVAGAVAVLSIRAAVEALR